MVPPSKRARLVLNQAATNDRSLVVHAVTSSKSVSSHQRRPRTIWEAKSTTQDSHQSFCRPCASISGEESNTS